MREVVENEIVDGNNKGDGAAKGDVKMRGEEEINVRFFDDARKVHLFTERVVRKVCNF